ncbi:MAG: alpha-glucosidase/alpha-galactosidase [Candidatus Bathyarchaeia archaeon]
MTFKVVLIGAGSHVFGQNLITDILSYPELRDCTISLVDIDKDRLSLTEAFARKLVDQWGFKTKIEATANRREALEGADYVVTSIRAGGLEATKLDLEIPLKYGVDQAVGDTVGPGGVFYGLKNASAILDICYDMEELCPGALLMNYTNPMAIVCWSVYEGTKVNVIGLCHSVQSTAHTLANYINVPPTEISYLSAGINHMSWFLEFKWHEEDAYPILRKRIEDPEFYKGPAGRDLVRIEVFKAIGYYPSESSHHLSEYLPYFRKRQDIMEKFKLVGTLRRIQSMGDRGKEDEAFRKLIESPEKIPIRRSAEYCSSVIHSMETGIPSLIYGNVRNTGLITNLPYGCCVEVPCVVDKTGVHPCYVGMLPPQCAALNRMNINVQELATKAILEKSKELVFQAVLVDPLTSAILTIDEIKNMVDEMFKAEEKYLKGFSC